MYKKVQWIVANKIRHVHISFRLLLAFQLSSRKASVGSAQSVATSPVRRPTTSYRTWHHDNNKFALTVRHAIWHCSKVFTRQTKKQELSYRKQFARQLRTQYVAGNIGLNITPWPWNIGFLFAFYSNYGRMYSHFGDIKRQRMASPWNLGLGSFKVIKNEGTNGKLD